jgi:two-component system, cell cycle response regulator DivK
MDRRHSRTEPLRPLVLLVDGNAHTLALYALALSAIGFNVLPAKNGAEAFTRAWQTHPDIIVTELPMPCYDGSQFLLDLKQSPRTREIPVVAMSGHVQAPIRELSEHDGFAAFFTKPCLPDELAEGLRQVLERKTHAVWG